MPDDPDHSSLAELGKQIEQAKKQSQGDENRPNTPGALHVSIDLLAGVLGGAFVGFYLDKWLDTLPLFFITCFFLGIAGAVRNILRTIRRSDQSKNDP